MTEQERTKQTINDLQKHKECLQMNCDTACNNCAYAMDDDSVIDALDWALALMKAQEPEASDVPKPDSDVGCWYYITHKYTLEQVVSALKAQAPQWIQFHLRELDDEERQAHPDWCYIIDSQTPDDGDDILVSDGKRVWADEYCDDGDGCYLESGVEITEDLAWRPMPEPPK